MNLIGYMHNRGHEVKKIRKRLNTGMTWQKTGQKQYNPVISMKPIKKTAAMAS